MHSTDEAGVRRSARIAAFPRLPGQAESDGREERPVPSKQEDHRLSGSTYGALDNEVPPIYTIDLSLPPAERYVEVAQDFKDELLGLTGLFDEVVLSLGVNVPLRLIHGIARIFLRSLPSKEETEELRGISMAVGVEMYLLICFNTLLDLFMGCTSGGVQVKAGESRRMLHFRTLDWGMDALRKMVVQLEFVEKRGGPVIGRSVTYVGFVGILTGTRQDLSLSLNFRPEHDDTTKLTNIKFYLHHLAVLLGIQPSIAAVLRGFMLPAMTTVWQGLRRRDVRNPDLPDLRAITESFPPTVTTAAYVIMSNGETTTIFEKDRIKAQTRSSQSFVVATNHDVELEALPNQDQVRAHKGVTIPGMMDLIEESVDRKECIERRWRKAFRRWRRSHPNGSEEDFYIDANTILRWIQEYPILNECTHYAVVMDPKYGEVLWLRRWLEPACSNSE